VRVALILLQVFVLAGMALAQVDALNPSIKVLVVVMVLGDDVGVTVIAIEVMPVGVVNLNHTS